MIDVSVLGFLLFDLNSLVLGTEGRCCDARFRRMVDAEALDDVVADSLVLLLVVVDLETLVGNSSGKGYYGRLSVMPIESE